MTNCENCGEDHSDETADYYRRAAEAIIATSSADRATMNERAQATLDDARQMWPDIPDKILQSFLVSQAYLVKEFSRMDVLNLSSALNAVFSNCTLAAAALSGAYDLTNGDTPKQTIEDLVAEVQERAAEDLSPFPGNYL